MLQILETGHLLELVLVSRGVLDSRGPVARLYSIEVAEKKSQRSVARRFVRAIFSIRVLGTHIWQISENYFCLH